MYYKQWLDSAPGINELVDATLADTVLKDSGSHTPGSQKKTPGLCHTPTLKADMSVALADLTNASQERNVLARTRIAQGEAALDIARQADKRKKISEMTELRSNAKKQYVDSKAKLDALHQGGLPFDNMMVMFLQDDIALAKQSYAHFTAHLQSAIAEPRAKDTPRRQPSQATDNSVGESAKSDSEDDSSE